MVVKWYTQRYGNIVHNIRPCGNVLYTKCGPQKIALWNGAVVGNWRTALEGVSSKPGNCGYGAFSF